MTRTIRSAVLALVVAVASFMAAAVLAGPAQAAPAATGSDGDRAATGSAFPRKAFDPGRAARTGLHAADVKRAGAATTGASSRAPLPGFCTFDRYDGVTSYIGCSVVLPVTIYVYCSNGNIFYGYLPYAGIWSLTATPCYATGYSLV